MRSTRGNLSDGCSRRPLAVGLPSALFVAALPWLPPERIPLSSVSGVETLGSKLFPKCPPPAISGRPLRRDKKGFPHDPLSHYPFLAARATKSVKSAARRGEAKCTATQAPGQAQAPTPADEFGFEPDLHIEPSSAQERFFKKTLDKMPRRHQHHGTQGELETTRGL